MVDKIVSLRQSLIDNELIGISAFKFGSPDEILFISGGPKSHLSNSSMICGPSNLRVLIRQPTRTVMPPSNKHSPIEGELKLNYQKLPFTAELEEWRHGCWYHSNSITANDLSDLFEQLKVLTPNQEFENEPKEFNPNKPFWAGSFAYDMVQWTQPISLQNLPKEGELLAVLWLVDKYISQSKNTDDFQVFSKNADWKEHVELVIENNPQKIDLPIQPANEFNEVSSLTDQQHEEMIEKIKLGISEGQVYQVNFGRFWSGRLVESPQTIFNRLLDSNPAPFSTLIYADDLGFSLISSSPESLLKSQNGEIYTSPIKGTYKSSSDPIEAERLREMMSKDVKERSEHRMLVDLMRNDLSAVCEVGSVNIERFDIETFSNVQHLVSHLKGRLLDSENGMTAFNSIFPGGSITGCPRTMVCAVIDQIENQSRSFWTGSAGWFDVHSGDGSWNILIRTIQAERKNNKWFGKVGSGGGITIKSDSNSEVMETYWKADALRIACGWTASNQKQVGNNQLSIHPLEIEFTNSIKNNGLVQTFEQWKENNNNESCGVLLIDNLDSFTLNIAHAMAGLSHNVTVISGRGKIADEMSTPSSLFNLLQKLNPSHIIIGPGPGTPSDSLLSKAVSLHCLAGQIDCPVLGICLGHQSLAAAEQGIVKKSPNGAIHGTPIICHHDGEGIFADLESPQLFTRYNSLTIEIDSSKSKMLITAKDENGEIMALRHKELPIMSVQFHPESIGSPNGLKLLENFLSINRMLE